MIKYYVPFFNNKEIKAVTRVIRSRYLVQGFEVEKLEENFRKYTKCKYAIAVSSATAGLFLSCMAIKEEYTSLYVDNITFIADYQAGMMATKLNENINLFSIYKDHANPFLIKRTPSGYKKTGILTHIGGKILKTYYDKTIHDCSHLFPIHIKDKDAISFVYSLHGSKIIGIGEGGVVCTNKKYIYDFIKLARQHGRDKIGYAYNYINNIANGNYKLSDLQACIANSLIDQKDYLLNRRSGIAKIYCNKLNIKYDNNNQYHLYQYDCGSIKRAKKIEKEFENNNVGFSKHFIPLDRILNCKYKNIADYEWYLRHISLPIYPDLTGSELNYIIDIINGC